MIRILHIVPNMQIGGLETFIMNIYRNINREEIQFDFLEHYKNKSAYDDEIKKLGGKVYNFTFRNDKNIFKYIFQLNNFFKVHKEYKIIHCHMESVGAIVFFIAKLHGIKIRIGHAHTNSTNKNIKGFIKKIISKPYKYFTTLNFACSKEAGEYLFGNKKFEIIPNAIEQSKYKFDLNVRNKLRKEFRINDDFVIGHVGRMDKSKNQIFLIDIFYQYLKINPNAKLVLVGDGEDRLKIENKINEYEIKNNVILLGVRNDINKIYSMFDLFVFPSVFEGLGIVLIEAQINGLNCITTLDIPKETKISNGITYLSLDDKSKWIETICQNEKRPCSLEYNELIYNYDILNLIKKLEDVYKLGR